MRLYVSSLVRRSTKSMNLSLTLSLKRGGKDLAPLQKLKSVDPQLARRVAPNMGMMSPTLRARWGYFLARRPTKSGEHQQADALRNITSP